MALCIISLEISKGENMKEITIKEFKNKNYIEIIDEIMKVNNGYVTSKMISELGIHRMYLNIMKEKGIIKKVGNGIYMNSKRIEDNYFILSVELPNVIYSHITALSFQGFSLKIGDSSYDITVPNNYFNYKIKNHNVFYVDKEIYNVGLIKVKTPIGNTVRVYDIERCICDIIRSKKRLNLEHVKYCVRTYLKRKDKDLVKLVFYAEKMNIKEEVIDFVNMVAD